MEFLGWPGFGDEEYKQAKSFLGNAHVLAVDENVTNKVIQLKRQHKMKLPDAVIAATCLLNDYTLVTRNIDDFGGIDLTIHNPFDGGRA